MSAPEAGEPRIKPGRKTDLGLVNSLIMRVVSLATGGRPPNVMTTLARHRGLFRRWLFYNASLMPGGILPRADTELLILRVAHRCGSDYERHHHERIGRAAGLSDEEIERVGAGPVADGWTDRQRLLLQACDELIDVHRISDETWGGLAEIYDERSLIEICLLVGHYAGLAATLNSLGVELDPKPIGSGGLAKVLNRR
jgi:alkylhydroperoxidase family enzyme